MDVDLDAVTEGGDGGVPHGAALSALAEAVVKRSDDIDTARAEVVRAVGDAGLVDTASIIGNFQMMDRIADSTGIPLDAPLEMLSRDVRTEIGLDQFASAQNTPSVGVFQRAGGRVLSSLMELGVKLSARRRR